MTEGASPKHVFSRRFIMTGGGEDARLAQDSLLEAVQQRNYDAGSCFAIRLALEEALSNAFKHGNKNDPGKVVTLDCRVDGQSVVLDVRDEGRGFDPDAVPAPDLEADLEERAIGGLGLYFMRELMDEVHFEFTPDAGNVLTMIKRREKTP